MKNDKFDTTSDHGNVSLDFGYWVSYKTIKPRPSLVVDTTRKLEIHEINILNGMSQRSLFTFVTILCLIARYGIK